MRGNRRRILLGGGQAGVDGRRIRRRRGGDLDSRVDSLGPRIIQPLEFVHVDSKHIFQCMLRGLFLDQLCRSERLLNRLGLALRLSIRVELSVAVHAEERHGTVELGAEVREEVDAEVAAEVRVADRLKDLCAGKGSALKL